MSIDYEFLVDWDQDEFFCSLARPGDALNLVQEPLTWSDFAITAVGTGGSDLQVNDTTAYGTQFTDWTVGTAASGSAYLAYGGGLDGITVTLVNGAAYTAYLFVDNTSASYDAIQLRLDVFNSNSGALIANGTAVTIPSTSGYQPVVCAFTAPAAVSVFLRLTRVNSSSTAEYHVSGPMVVAGTFTAATAPGFNVGGASNGYDLLTAFVMDARWNIGAREAYVAVADDNELQITLNNVSRAFSPETPGGPLNGLLNDRYIEINMQSATSIKRRMYFGYVQSVQPATGATSGPYTAILRAAGERRYWEGVEIRLALQVNQRSNQVVTAIKNEVDLPPSPFVINALETGSYQWPYAGDNWGDGVDALSALATVVESERGFLYWSQDGAMVLRNRAWRYDTDDAVSVLSATFDNDFIRGVYDFGEDLFNVVEVKFYPRRIAGASATLWELEESISLSPLQVVKMIAKYTLANNNRLRVAANSVAQGTYTTSATINVAYEHKANQTIITYTNPSGVATRSVTAHTLTGLRVTDANMVSVIAEDAASIALYGRKALFLDLKLINRRVDAQEAANLELARHKDPRGHMRSITIRPRTDARDEDAIDLTVTQKIRVIEDQTGHDGNYIIVGVEYRVREALTDLEVTYYLEPAVDLI